MSAKDCVGGSRKLPVLMMFSTVFRYADSRTTEAVVHGCLTPKVGGTEKVQNYADMIFGWSLKLNYCS